MAEGMENPESIASQGSPKKAGALLREARLAAGVDAVKLCASLRISTAALDALEACQYDRLPGDPYVRALIGSVARSIGTDPQKIMRAYNNEMGAAFAEPSVAPYKDVSEVQGLAHRKLFFALLAVLLLGLLFILGKVNSSSEKKAAAAEPAHTDTVAVAIPPPSDSVPESSALRPDSLKTDSGKVATKDTVAANAKPVVKDTVAPAAVKNEKTFSRVTIKCIADSTRFRVFRMHKATASQTIFSGQQMEFMHNDTITVVLYSKRNAEISYGDTTVTPKEHRFKVYGKTIIYF